jgi:hypothetical protein
VSGPGSGYEHWAPALQQQLGIRPIGYANHHALFDLGEKGRNLMALFAWRETKSQQQPHVAPRTDIPIERTTHFDCILCVQRKVQVKGAVWQLSLLQSQSPVLHSPGPGGCATGFFPFLFLPFIDLLIWVFFHYPEFTNKYKCSSEITYGSRSLNKLRNVI